MRRCWSNHLGTECERTLSGSEIEMIRSDVNAAVGTDGAATTYKEENPETEETFSVGEPSSQWSVSSHNVSVLDCDLQTKDTP